MRGVAKECREPVVSLPTAATCRIAGELLETAG
jgi:hypothetical protein